MRKGFIVFSVLMLAIAAADVSAQMGSRRGSGRVGADRAAKAQEKPQESVDQLALILAELQEDLKLTANQHAAWDAYARSVEALASDLARERGRTKEVMQMRCCSASITRSTWRAIASRRWRISSRRRKSSTQDSLPSSDRWPIRGSRRPSPPRPTPDPRTRASGPDRRRHGNEDRPEAP